MIGFSERNIAECLNCNLSLEDGLTTIPLMVVELNFISIRPCSVVSLMLLLSRVGTLTLIHDGPSKLPQRR